MCACVRVCMCLCLCVCDGADSEEKMTHIGRRNGKTELECLQSVGGGWGCLGMAVFSRGRLW